MSMGKNIYDMLNDVKINEAEYEKTDLSEFDKAQKKQRILRKVRAMESSKSGKGRMKAAIAAAAACAVIVGTIGATNPKMASDLFINTIGKLIENRQETKEDYEAKIYQKIGENSSSAKANEYIATDDVNGVSISISDVYCDGYVLYYTAVLKTDNEVLNQADFIKSNTAIDTVTNYENAKGGVYSSFEKASDGTFVKSGEIDLIGYGKDSAADLIADGESLEIECSLDDLTGYKDNEWDENGEYVSTGAVEGQWKLSFPVKVDRYGNVSYSINKEDNGVKLCNVVKTKVGLVLTVETPDFSKAPYNDPDNDPELSVVDSDGNYLEWISGGSVQNDDGTATCQLMVFNEGQTDFTFEVTNKNADDSKIASINFQVK